MIAASVLPAWPAAAEEPPAPDTTSVVEPSETPTPADEPAPDSTPTTEPSTEPTPATEPTPTTEPTASPTPTSTPGGTVQYSGTAQQISDDGLPVDQDITLFGVSGQGYLSVDVSALATNLDASTPVALMLQVPAGLTLSSDPDARFTQLADAGARKPLVAISSYKVKQTAPRETSELVNQTPLVSATHHVFAVYVSPSNKKVKDAAQGNDTAATTLINYANTYWDAQSGNGTPGTGSIHFTLDGVVPWYQSTYSCATNAGSTSLWNQAMTKAKTAGFIPGKNNHLVLIMPNGGPNYSYCGGAIGLGTIGGSVNQGGMVWVMGSSDPMAKETVAHELGHNMSLGHADWLSCPLPQPNVGQTNVDYGSATRAPGIVGCTVNNYGDTTDVMGFGVGDGVAGALSSPQAIRAGIWPASAFQTAPIGVDTNYNILPVSGHTGLRSVVVQDSDGTLYFVELRNLLNDDSTNYIGCDDQACTLAVPNVRILRLEPSGFSGAPGYDTYLIGRSSTGVGYTGAGTYTLPSGDTIKVISVSASSANIKVTRSAHSTTEDWVVIKQTLGYDAKLRAGDTLTTLLGDFWDADSYVFHWTRDGSEFLTSATAQSYALTSADVGHRINVYVTSTPAPPGGYDNSIFGSQCATAPNNLGIYNCAGPSPVILAGVYQASEPGPVTINAATTPFQAVTPVGGAGNWPTGTTFTHQWLRGASATTATTAATGLTSSTATTSAYTPNAADYNQFLRLKVTATVPGYSPAVRYSAAANYSIQSPSVITVAGTPKIGTQVTVDDSAMAFFTPSGVDLTGVTKTYQWLRNGVPITDTFNTTIDATDDPDYTLRSLDYNASITLRVTASKPGWVSKVTTTTPVFKPNQLGTIQATSPTASIANVYDSAAPTGVVLTATTAGVTETELSAPSYQWYRINLTTSAATLISGATTSVYKPVAADYPYKIKVVVTVKKPNYASLPLAFTRDFSLRPDTTPGFGVGFDGSPVKVDSTIGLNLVDMSFHAETTPGSFNTVHLASPGVAHTVQWRRAGVNVAGQVGDTYTLGSADLGKIMSYSLKVTYNGYIAFNGASPNTVAVAPAAFVPGAEPAISDGSPNFNTKTVQAAFGDVTPPATSLKFQWYRDATPISGATTASYTIGAADYGKTVSVRVSYLRAGYATHVMNGDPGGSGKWWLSAAPAVPVLTDDSQVRVGGTLVVDDNQQYTNMTDGTPVPDVDVVKTYRWYRSGVLITTPDATDNDGAYEPVAPDKGKVITVKVTASAPSLPYLLPSIATTAATQAVGTNLLEGWNEALDDVSTTSTTSFDTTLVAPPHKITSVPIVVKYQWYRDSTAISGATTSKYKPTTSDIGKQIWVRIVITKAASGATTYTPVVKYSNKKVYSITTTPAQIAVSTLAVGQQVQTVENTYETVDGPLGVGELDQKYQWLRNGATIAGATSWHYTLQAADAGAKISVRITTAKVGGGYIPNVQVVTTLPSTLTVQKGVLEGDTALAPEVTMEVPATNTLKAWPPAVTGSAQSGSPSATFTYQWLRNGAAISKATGSTFKLSSADSGKDISVRVTASLAGYGSIVLPVSTPLNYNIKVITGSEPYASIGEWAPGNQPSVYGENFITKDGALAFPIIKYQWLRAGAAIAGAIENSYVLQPADVGKLIQVRLTVSAPGYLPLVYTTLGVPGTIGHHVTDPSVAVVPGPGVGTLTAVMTGMMPATPAATYTYKWYRAGAAAPIATTAQYKLVAADAGKLISVLVTMTRAGFDVGTKALPKTGDVDYTIYADATKPTIAGTAKVGEQLSATAPDFYDDAEHATVAVGITPVYTWYRSGVAIAGATADTYTLVAADKGKVITVKVTATKAGRLAVASPVSVGTAAVGAGTLVVGSYAPVTSVNLTTRKATVTFTGSATTAGPFTTTYKWYRNNVAISGATASSYVLLTTDTNKAITVVVTIAKSGYTSHAFSTAPGQLVNGFTQGEAAVIGHDSVAGAVTTATVGQTLNCLPPLYYKADGTGLQPYGATPNGTQTIRWFSDSTEVTPDVGSSGLNYLLKSSDLDHTVTCEITVGAALHKSHVETVSPGVVVS